MSPACAGRFQSPVDIRPELTAFCPALRPLELFGFELPPLPELRLRNNGHTGEGVVQDGASGKMTGRGLNQGSCLGGARELGRLPSGAEPARFPIFPQCS